MRSERALPAGPGCVRLAAAAPEPGGGRRRAAAAEGRADERRTRFDKANAISEPKFSEFLITQSVHSYN